VVGLLAYADLRFGEMTGLRIRRVDFRRKRLTVAESATEVGGTVQYGTPKTNQQRTVPIPAALFEPLDLDLGALAERMDAAHAPTSPTVVGRRVNAKQDHSPRHRAVEARPARRSVGRVGLEPTTQGL
jgi:hypothetical protein